MSTLWIWISIGIIAAAALVCIFVILGARRKTERILKSIDRMLEAAMNGEFSEKCYDESLLSSVESRFAQYLAASEVSARNLTAEKDKIKELVSDISHQTKTPISNILLYSQLLAEQPLTDEAAACVEPLNVQAEKLRFLIDALVKTSRLEAGIFALNPEMTRVSPLLNAAIEQILPLAEAKNISLSCEETSATAVFDLKWTIEALYNLLDNAVKYTPSGGRVSVTVGEYEMFCRVTVSDTGRGIPEEEQTKIFGRFYRSPAVSREQGVGIGLYLSRQIAVAQGGYIKVASAVGKGTDMSLFLRR